VFDNSGKQELASLKRENFIWKRILKFENFNEEKFVSKFRIVNRNCIKFSSLKRRS